MNIYLTKLILLIMTGFFVNQKRGFIKINIGNFPITLSKTVPFSVFWIVFSRLLWIYIQSFLSLKDVVVRLIYSTIIN